MLQKRQERLNNMFLQRYLQKGVFVKYSLDILILQTG